MQVVKDQGNVDAVVAILRACARSTRTHSDWPIAAWRAQAARRSGRRRVRLNAALVHGYLLHAGVAALPLSVLAKLHRFRNYIGRRGVCDVARDLAARQFRLWNLSVPRATPDGFVTRGIWRRGYFVTRRIWWRGYNVFESGQTACLRPRSNRGQWACWASGG